MVNRSALLSLALLLALPAVAHADDAAPAPAPAPAAPETRVHHAPITSAPGSQDLMIRAEVDRPDLSKRVILVYRAGSDELHEVDLVRAAGDYAAAIPGDQLHSTLAYALEVETLDGKRRAIFATRTALHEVHLLGDIADLREQAQLERVGGRRSVLMVSAEGVYFGKGDATDVNGKPYTVSDAYWRTDASYTYRFLRTVTEFGIRFGVVRGSSVVPGAGADPNVGLNYGAARVRLRATDWLHFEGDLLTSVTEIGFSIGAGGAILLGDPYGAKLTIGGEGIQVFGGRGYVKLDVPAGRRFMLSPIVEVTNMPHASQAGARLLLDTSADLGKGVGIVLRLGYMARTWTDAGFGGGVSVSYAF